MGGILSSVDRNLVSVLFLLLLTGACSAPSGTRGMLPVEQDIVIDTIARWDAWAQATGEASPVTDSCYQQLMEVGVVVVHTHEEMLAITGHCGPDANHPLFDPNVEGVFDSSASCPTGATEIRGQARMGYIDRNMVVVIADTSDWCTTFPHEILHHLNRCMGLGSDPGHDGDTWHELGLQAGQFLRTQGPTDPNWAGCPGT